MKKLLLSILFFVGCEEAGLNTDSITNGSNTQDTLFVVTYDSLIIIYDTLIINQSCNNGAILDDCGICTGGNSNLEFNYLMDCNNVCGGNATINGCGECVEISEPFAECDIELSMNLEIAPLDLFYYINWYGSQNLATLNISNFTNKTKNIYLSYIGSLNGFKVVEGKTKYMQIESGESLSISNKDYNFYNIVEYEIDYANLALHSLGYLTSGNYDIQIFAKEYNSSESYYENISEGKILGYYSLDSLYQNPD